MLENIIIRTKNLCKVYNKEVVANDNLNIDIKRGEIFGLLGPNGAGKSTFIRQIAGLIAPTSGEIYFEGNNVVKSPSVIPNYISYFGQQLVILDSHKVWEAVYYTGLFRGLEKGEALKQSNFLIELFDLEEVRNKLMSKLSGGQKKIVGLISTIIGFRPIIILDEPTNDLDPENRRRVWSILSYLNKKFNITILLVTHNVLEAEQVIERVAIIDKGKVIGMGTPAELKAQMDDKVRLELFLKEEYKNEDLIFDIDKLDNILSTKKIKSGVWRFMTNKNLASEAFSDIIKNVGFERIDDFRVVTSTLEDVYLALGGSKNGIK